MRPPASSAIPRLLAASLALVLLPTTLDAAPSCGHAPGGIPGDTVDGGPPPVAGPVGVPFPAPLASPLEPRTRLAPVHAARGGRSRWVGLVNLGEAFPFALLSPRREEDAEGGAEERGEGAPAAVRTPALWGEIAGGAFSRFDLEGRGNEFVEVHYRVGLRLRARWRAIDARLAFYHVSSHLGDEFLERTGRAPISTSREGLELLAGVRPLPDPLPGVRLYGGPGLLVRSTAGLAPASVRIGAEWRPRGSRWGSFRPYASAELFAWEERGWEPLAAAEAGLAFGGRYRIALLAGAGPSRAEQFFRQDETLWGLSLGADF